MGKLKSAIKIPDPTNSINKIGTKGSGSHVVVVDNTEAEADEFLLPYEGTLWLTMLDEPQASANDAGNISGSYAKVSSHSQLGSSFDSQAAIPDLRVHLF